ncbi:MAG: hypothetical protein ABSH48_28060 [Verrucomicrobiota bacterium]
MKSSRLKRVARFAVPMLTAGNFFLDWLNPLGIVDWVLYFIPLLLSFYASDRFSGFRQAGCGGGASLSISGCPSANPADR